MSRDLDQTLTEAATLLSRSGLFDRSDLVEVPEGYYEVGDEIARGGMGRISTARDLRSGRIVAIKEVLAEVFEAYPADERDEVLSRFCREAVITARLEHPSIVPVYEIGRFGEAPFFAMQRVTGEPLHDHISAAGDFEERLALLPKVAAVAEAIAYAHDRGVIHRDLKPGNVLVGEFGETLVIDWGLAKDIGAVEEGDRSESLAETSIDETLEGSVIGTPQYMPPEQARGEPVDRRADVYAVGAILYHLLGGQPPYPLVRKKGVNPIVDVLRRVRDTEPEPLDELAPETPPDLESIVAKAMARDPEARYADAGELAADLESFQRGQLVAVHDYSAGELLRRWLRRHRAAVITAAVLITALIGSAVWFVITNRQARQTAESEKRAAETAIDRWVSMFEQRGRAELHHGDIATAALILSETYQQLPGDPGVATMVADAMRAIAPLERVVKLSDSPIFGIAANDERIVAAAEDGTLFVLDAPSGETVSTSQIGDADLFVRIGADRVALVGDRRIAVLDARGARRLAITPREPILSVGTDRDGRFIAIGSRRGLVEVFDLETGERRAARRFSQLPDPSTMLIFTVAITPDHSVLISGPGSVSLWESPDLEVKRWEASANQPYVTASVSSSLPRVVVGGNRGRALLLELATGKVIRTLDGHTGRVKSTFTAGGTRVVTWDESATRIWDAESGQLLSALRGWAMKTTALAASDRDRLLALGGHTGTIAVVDPRTGRVHSRLVGHAGAVHALDFAPGDVLVSTGSDGIVKRWNIADLRVKSISLGGRPYLFRRGDRLLSYGDKVPTQLWDLSEQREIATLSPAGGRAAMSPDGELVVTREGLYSTADGSRLSSFELPDSAITLAVSANGIATVDGGDAVRLLDHQGSLLREVQFPGSRLVVVEMAGDGERVAVPDLGVAHVIDLSSGDRRTLTHDPDLNKLVRVETVGEDRLLTVTVDSLALWDVESGTELYRLTPGASKVGVAPGGEVVAISREGRVDLWYPGRDVVRVPIEDHGRSGSVTFSADARRMITTSEIVRIWELETREVLIQRDIGKPWIISSYLVDGDDTVVTVSASELGFWDVTPETRDPEVIRRLVADTVPRDFKSGRGVISRPVPAGR